MNSQKQLAPPPDTLVSPLLELRNYYARLVEEYEGLFLQARSQLENVDSLLSHWSFVNGSTQRSQLKPADETLVVQSEAPALLVYADHAPDIDAVPSTEYSPTKLVAKTTKSEAILEKNDHGVKGPEVPMLPHYESLSRMEAITRLLQEYIGAVCHIDFVVRSLYGDLEPNLFKVVKGRVQSSLTQGRERGYWSAIPNEPGCYTLDLGLVIPTNGHSASMGGKSKRKKPFFIPKTKVVPMLRPYEGQFLIDAITVFLRQHPGEVFNVGQVVNGIYGELNDEEMREVKNKVLNELSRGHRTGRFSRVPNKIGLYQY